MYICIYIYIYTHIRYGIAACWTRRGGGAGDATRVPTALFHQPPTFSTVRDVHRARLDLTTELTMRQLPETYTYIYTYNYTHTYTYTYTYIYLYLYLTLSTRVKLRRVARQAQPAACRRIDILSCGADAASDPIRANDVGIERHASHHPSEQKTTMGVGSDRAHRPSRDNTKQQLSEPSGLDPVSPWIPNPHFSVALEWVS